jgi:hypothetical protein
MSSQAASMLTPHGEKHPGKAMPDPARDRAQARRGGTGRTHSPDAVHRQSPNMGQPDPRPGRSGSGAGGPSLQPWR